MFSKLPLASLPIDIVWKLIDRFDYVDLVVLAESGPMMRDVIGNEMKTKGFVSRWLAKLVSCPAEKNKDECHTQVGRLIHAVFDDTADGLEVLKTLLVAGYTAVRSFEGVGLMVGAYLSCWKHPRPDIVTTAFLNAWTVSEYLDHAVYQLERHIDTLDVFERLHFDAPEDVDDGMRARYAESQTALFLVHDSVRKLCFSTSTSPHVQRLLLVEAYKRAASPHVLFSDDVRLAAFVTIVVTRRYADNSQVLDRFHFGSQNVFTVGGRAEIARLADVFALLLAALHETSSPDDVAVLADVYHAVTAFPQPWSLPARSALLAAEPSLLRLHLHDPHVFMKREHAVNVFSALLWMHEWRLDEHKYEQFLTAVFRTRRRCSEDVLARFAQMVLSNSLEHDKLVSRSRRNVYEARHNRFYVNFFRILDDE